MGVLSAGIFSPREEERLGRCTSTRDIGLVGGEAIVNGPRSGGNPSNHQGSANHDEKMVDQAHLHSYINVLIHS